MTSTCVICGSSSLTSYFSKNSFATMRCGTCGLAYTHPMPSAEQIAEIYRDHYFASHYTDIEKWHRGNVSPGEIACVNMSALVRVAEIQGILREFGVRDHVKFLELGSSYGIVLSAGELLGWDVWGVEINETLATYCREVMGLNVLCKSIEEAVPLLPRDFHALALYHVIEHVRDPMALALQLFSLVRRGGIVVIQTPNIESRNSLEQSSAWEYFKPPEHLWYFSESSLKALLKRVGFRPMECKGSDSKTMLKQILRAPIFRIVHALGITLNPLRNFQIAVAIFKKFRTKSINSDDAITIIAIKP